MKISFIIPAFNEAMLLPNCLRSIHQNSNLLDARKWDWEMIVCDNNSTDQTNSVARKAGAKVVFEKINQISRARNKGAKIAKGEWLIFVDADSLVSKDLIEECARMIETEKVIGGGAILQAKGRWAWKMWLPVFIWNCISRSLHWAAGAFIFCRRDAFQKLGGFDEKRFAAEELDLSIRLKQLAKSKGLHFTILKRGFLQTSARKAGLYSFKELIFTFLSLIFRHRGITENRHSCFLWYDGRR